MVTGRKPFYGGRNEVLEAHLHTPPPRPSEFAHVSPDLERVIVKSLAKDPAERYQTGAEFIAALDYAELTPEPDNALTGRLRRLFGVVFGCVVVLLVHGFSP